MDKYKLATELLKEHEGITELWYIGFSLRIDENRRPEFFVWFQRIENDKYENRTYIYINDIWVWIKDDNKVELSEEAEKWLKN